MDKPQKIGCTVESCKFHDSDECCCKLDEIKVSCTCAADDAKNKTSTICDNFECKCKDCK